MLNIDMVNAHIACVNRAVFCEILLVLGRFLLFKNPVKYAINCNINHGHA